MKDPLLHAHELTRRDFAVRTAGMLLGVGLLPGAFSSPAHADTGNGAKAKNVIYLYMDGGMSHLDTLDPKPGTAAAGPVKTIDTSADGVRVSEYLPLTARQMHLGTVVRSLTSTQGAHQQGNYFMHTSYQLGATIRHPSMGAWLSLLQGGGNPTLPSSVYIGNNSQHPGRGFLSAAHQPLFVNNPENGLINIKCLPELTDNALSDRLSLAAELDSNFRTQFPQRNVKAYSDMYDHALSMMRSKDIVAFDLKQEKPELRKAYGSDPFGQGCLLARRLVEHGVRFVEVSLHGWDTHVANFVKTPELCDILDKGLATLLSDLNSRGMLNDTMVVLTTEFGRTPDINTATGRDHYPKAFSCAMFGGGVKAGAIHGKTDKNGAEVEEEMITIPSFNATIAYALGLPLDKVITSPSNRPFTVADKGKPATAIFA